MRANVEINPLCDPKLQKIEKREEREAREMTIEVGEVSPLSPKLSTNCAFLCCLLLGRGGGEWGMSGDRGLGRMFQSL